MIYELRTYTAAPGKMDALMARFRDHTLKFFEKHGMTNVGYWVLADAKEGDEQKIIYLLEFPTSRRQGSRREIGRRVLIRHG